MKKCTALLLAFRLLLGLLLAALLLVVLRGVLVLLRLAAAAPIS